MTNKIIFKSNMLALVCLATSLPSMAMAATPTTYIGLVDHILGIINIIIPTIFGSVFVYFMWMMIDCWVINAGDPQKQEAGRKYAVSAVVMFVVMVSAWGIVAMLKSSLFG